MSVPGIPDPSPYSQAEFDFAGNGSSVGSDTNNLTALGGTGSAVLAASYVDNTNPSLLTLKGLTRGFPYTVTFLSVGTTTKPGSSRIVSFSSGTDNRNVDQNLHGNDNGIRVDYSFVASDTNQVVTIARVTAGSFPLYALALRSGFIVTTTANSGAGSLRQAFADAAAIPGPDTITFSESLSGALSLTSPIAVADSVTVDASGLAAGAIVSAAGGSRHFTLNSAANLTLRGLTLAGGVSGTDGGAIFNNGGVLTLARCTFSGNLAAGSGGAIFNAGFLSAADCTFSGNSATTNGGALANGSGGEATLTRCTFSANAHTGSTQGGGAINHANVASRMTLRHCTLAGNDTTGSDGGGGVRTRGPEFTLENCIVAGNTAGNGSGADIQNSTALTALGANIVQSRGGNGVVVGTLTPADPLLAALGDFGGPTATRALLPGSPARNSGSVLSPPQTADQRGFPIVGAPDIGAYEAGTPSNYNAWIWETLPASASPEQHGAGFDFDGDNVSNEDEWTALTNPAGNQVLLRLTDGKVVVTNSTVTFSTIAGLPYQLQSFHNPEALLWRNEGSSVVGTGSPMTLPVTRSDAGPNFFRVVEGPPPPSLNLVTVGNPGNAADPASNGLGGQSGAVAYEYKIGKYEVTNAEYATFLNAVDPNGLNALALYNDEMYLDQRTGGIFPNAYGFKYTARPGFANKPVVYVSFYDAMRFCNWLHNGARAGGDTENGAYTLEGNTATPSNGTTVTRNAGAKFVVPSEDEWYKAAYFQPPAAGGPEDSYWLFPTGSDSAPNAATPPGTALAANYDFSFRSVTPVGAYATTTGFYGTFDMAGNVFEWVDTIYHAPSRVLRGGSWDLNRVEMLSYSAWLSSPEFEGNFVGFRVASP